MTRGWGRCFWIIQISSCLCAIFSGCFFCPLAFFFWGHFQSFFRTRTLFPTFPPEIAQGFWLQLWGLRTLINPFVAEKPEKNWFFWNRTFWNRTTNYVQFPISKEGKIHKKTLAIHTIKLGENLFRLAARKTGRIKFEDDTVFKAISNRGENKVLLSWRKKARKKGIRLCCYPRAGVSFFPGTINH